MIGIGMPITQARMPFMEVLRVWGHAQRKRRRSGWVPETGPGVQTRGGT